jgi:hypothetical protein
MVHLHTLPWSGCCVALIWPSQQEEDPKSKKKMRRQEKGGTKRRERTKKLELYIELVFSGRYRSLLLGIYHTDTKGSLGRYILVPFFWQEPFFLSKRGHWPPF